MSVDADTFKAGLAQRAGGVTIVTARAGGRIHGMTVTDFTGVSVDPPLVLVCADKTSNTLEFIREGRCFAVNLLARGQEALSNKFASKKDEFRRFEDIEVETGKTGAPLLPDVLASIDCSLEAEHDAGDHVIFVGRVEQLVQRELEPLVYHAGRYCSLSES